MNTALKKFDGHELNGRRIKARVENLIFDLSLKLVRIITESFYSPVNLSWHKKMALSKCMLTWVLI